MNKQKSYKTKEIVTVNEVFKELIAEHGEPAVLLKGLRTKEGLSRVDFAKAISITQQNLSAMENSRRPIDKEIVKRIAEKFGVDYRSLLILR